MKDDARWRTNMEIADKKERSQAYRLLRNEYGVGDFFTREIAGAHWKASKYMPDLLDRRAANALGHEIWLSIEAWLYRGGGLPRTDHPRTRNMAWGNDLGGGLTLKSPHRGYAIGDSNLSDLHLLWGTASINKSSSRLHSKKLDLSLDWSCVSASRRTHIQTNLPALRRVGISREIVRGRSCYWAHLCLDCPPYRSRAHIERMASRPADMILGLDMGPTSQAWATADDSGEIVLGAAALARVKETAARERRCQRALDRSRRATNPECYDERKRAIKGKRPRTLSKRGQRLQIENTEDLRVSAAQRKSATIKQAQAAALLAPRIRVEDQNFRSWQKQYGKRMTLTAPGLFLQRLSREATLSGGVIERLPLRSAFSQYCVCGTKIKKPRSQDWHECDRSACPLYHLRLDRHLFSAFLMRATASAERGIIALHEGVLATSLVEEYGGVPVFQESLLRLCGKRRGRGKHPEGVASVSIQHASDVKGVVGRSAQLVIRGEDVSHQPTLALPTGDAVGTSSVFGSSSDGMSSVDGFAYGHRIRPAVRKAALLDRERQRAYPG